MPLLDKVKEFFAGFQRGAPPPGHGQSAQSPTADGGDLSAGFNPDGVAGEGDAPKNDGR